MNNLFKIFSVVFLFSLASCSVNNINNPITSNDAKGNIGLKIDKSTIPSDVVLVRAILTRDGFSEIVSEVSVQDTNSTDIYLNNVEVGSWSLNVKAFSSESVVLYEGTALVEITANTTTLVSLVLNPVTNSVGSIYISIFWGSPTAGWTDLTNNPILNSSNTNYDSFGVSQPFVIKENNIYKMWYNGLSGGGMAYVFYATSVNGIDWNRRETPVLFPGNDGDWDSGRAGPGPVIKIDNTYYMYYHSWQYYTDMWGIGLATSTDGINWTKYPQPILIGGDWDYHLMATSIVHKNNLYYMYYSGGSDYRVGLAISSDGISWTKSELNPIITPTLNWEHNSTGYPSVILEDGIFKMVYVSLSTETSFFGWATSPNGVDWDKRNLPIFSNTNVNSLFYRIHYPNLMNDENKYKLYYSVYDNQNILHISLATKTK